MKNKIFFSLAVSIFLPVMLIACATVRERELSMKNPASVKCIRDGGELLTVPSKEGEYGVCLFSDGSVCEEWEYFRGKCARGDCMKKCMKPGTSAEGWYDCSGLLIKQEKCSEK
jgi:putative hemolysin